MPAQVERTLPWERILPPPQIKLRKNKIGIQKGAPIAFQSESKTSHYSKNTFADLGSQ